ncbi:TlpA disulfide reductase family protein [Chitinophaga rhizophila]|uniref:AhpC/TSA family protein n=1 Tax=Chitinophaga rhizophila TaxID=2866212 RepID=A0ABS7GL15_9BACT|nr:TlpA disulfide reductase family protein [Chitinophaga rhizophila]MBW8687118.1 AhpC/TSA family protein [Chitinophaga rhizophila]
MNRCLAVIAACCMAMPAMSQSFQIKGKLGRLQAPAKVYIGYSYDGKSVYDSADVDGGNFSFDKPVAYPTNILLTVSRDGEPQTFFNASDIAHLYVEPGSIVWVTSDESIANFTSNGSKSQDDYDVYLRHMEDAEEKLSLLTVESSNTLQNDVTEKGLAAKKQYMEHFRAAMANRKKSMKEFIQQHPDMYISLDILEEYAGNFIDFREIEPMFKALVEKTRTSVKGKAFDKKIQASKRTAVGAPAPDFAQKDLQGNKVTLSSFKGKVVILNFWASWSATSRLENQELKQIIKAYNQKDLVVIHVSLDERKEQWAQAITDDKMTGYNVSDLKFLRNEVAELYNIHAVPQNVVIDAAGNIIGRNIKGNQLSEKLAELIGNK